MTLIVFSFLSLFLMFFSSMLFKLYTLFLAFLVLIVALQFTLSTNSLLTVFDYYISLYQFKFINLNYVLAFDGLTLYFILLTVLLFIVCILLA
jgi:NADH:ubiquinone oxidoreductase subunit 4 (subunit M)